MGKLNPLQVRNLKEPGRYSDGDGLILEVRPGGSKSWIARLQANGRRRAVNRTPVMVHSENANTAF